VARIEQPAEEEFNRKMNSSRETFFYHVRQALKASTRPGEAAGIEGRNGIGYQGGGSDLAAWFRQEFTKAGGVFHLVADSNSAVSKVSELIQQKSASRVLVGRGPLLDQLELPTHLNQPGIEVLSVDGRGPEGSWDPFFAADAGVSGVDFLVAETGTIVLHARPDQPRALSLLPPVHIAVAERSQIVPDLFDLFEPPADGKPTFVPACVSLITGPSKTGDIELRLVTGVHGPGEIHLVLIAG
jgi:L-lactate dehydrogenase complex protein LldG